MNKKIKYFIWWCGFNPYLRGMIDFQLPVTDPKIMNANLNTATRSLSIIISLSVQLAGRKEFAAICIKNAISSNVPCETILSTVRDMIVDNPENMEKILGEKLCIKILKC